MRALTPRRCVVALRIRRCAVWRLDRYKGVVIAESKATVKVEGNHYFPAAAIDMKYFKPSAANTHTTCGWKGYALRAPRPSARARVRLTVRRRAAAAAVRACSVASYYDVQVGGSTVADGAWFYPQCKVQRCADAHTRTALWRALRRCACANAGVGRVVVRRRRVVRACRTRPNTLRDMWRSTRRRASPSRRRAVARGSGSARSFCRFCHSARPRARSPAAPSRDACRCAPTAGQPLVRVLTPLLALSSLCFVLAVHVTQRNRALELSR